MICIINYRNSVGVWHPVMALDGGEHQQPVVFLEDCQVTPTAQPNLQPVHGFGQAQSHTKFHKVYLLFDSLLRLLQPKIFAPMS